MNIQGERPSYLGDGVYVAHDGFQLILQVPETASSTDITQTIYLEDAAFRNLAHYVKTHFPHWVKE